MCGVCRPSPTSSVTGNGCEWRPAGVSTNTGVTTAQTDGLGVWATGLDHVCDSYTSTSTLLPHHVGHVPVHTASAFLVLVTGLCHSSAVRKRGLGTPARGSSAGGADQAFPCEIRFSWAMLPAAIVSPAPSTNQLLQNSQHSAAQPPCHPTEHVCTRWQRSPMACMQAEATAKAADRCLPDTFYMTDYRRQAADILR
jgi:hypothetical protein